MSYFGSFSSPRDEPYGSARYATNDTTWSLNQPSNQWQPQQPRYEQPRYDPPRYGQLFEQPRYEQSNNLTSRPMNPMAGAPQPLSGFPRYSYMTGTTALGDAFRNDRFNDRRGGGGGRGGSDNRQWLPQDDVRGGGSFRNDGRNGGRGGNRGGNYGNSGSYGSNGRNGDNRRQNGDRKRNDSDYVKRRANNATSSPKVVKNKDYAPSRIAPASAGRSTSNKGYGNKERGQRSDNNGGGGRRDGGKVFGKDRGGRGGEKRGPMKKRNNRSTDLEFTPIPSDVAYKSFVVKGENLVCFQGLQSVLATQHEFPIVIDGKVYTSVDHFYQIEKCKQLSDGKDCEPLIANLKEEADFTADDVKAKIADANKNYGQLARDFLKENKIDRQTVEEWRRAGGVVATYTAMRAKAQQCAEMRELLHSSVNKIIVHTYAGDAIFGSGTRVQFVHKWADDMAKTNGKIQIPLLPLSDRNAISMAPQIAQGRNILGLIHMQLAEDIGKGALPFVVTSASLEVSNVANTPSPSRGGAADVDLSEIDLDKEEDEVMEL